MKISRLHKALVLFLFVTLILSGCKENEANIGLDNGYSPSLSAHFLKAEIDFRGSFPSEGGSASFSVESLETPWRFSDNPEWITLEPNSGTETKTGTIKVAENNLMDDRTGIFYINSTTSDWNFQKTLSVSQKGSSPMISAPESTYTFGGGAGSQTIKITSNCNWSAVTNSSWLTAEKSEDGSELILSVSENTSSNYRNATVNLTYNYSTYQTLTVEQFPADINVSDSKLTMENYPSSYQITVTSESAWQTVVSASWIQVNPSEGEAGETKVSIEVTQNESVNERIGYVAFYTGNSERLQIEIRQRGLYIESVESLTFTSREETVSVPIQSNMDWQVNQVPDWLSITPMSGSGNGELTVTVAANPSLEPRNGNIIITSSTMEVTIPVYQAGLSLTPGSKLLQFDDKGGEMDLTITADGPWTSEVSDTWISASPLSGPGDTTVKVRVEENTTEDAREGKIIYFFGDIEIVVSVLQESKYFDIDSTEFTFPAEGGSHIIQVGTNQPWEAMIENNPEWLSLSDYSGEGEKEISVDATPNTTSLVRTATIVITPQHSQAIRISVAQEGLYLRIDTSSVSFFAKGGESDLINIDSNGTAVITSSDAWISIDNVSEKSFKIVVGQNESSDRRKGNVKVTLQNVTDSSLEVTIPVEQASYGDSFIIDQYPSDSDWTNASSGSLSISISGYPEDSDWN